VKRFVVILVILLIIIFGGTFIVWRQLPQLVSYMIAQQTHTHVHINAIRFRQDEIHFDTIIIDSPEGGTIQKALKVEELIIKAPFTAYTKSPVIIPEVILNNIYLGIEFYNKERTKGNWVTIMSDIDEEPQEKKEVKKPQTGGQYLDEKGDYGLIKDLDMNTLNIELKLHNESPVKLSTIKNVHFKDVRTDNGQIGKELTQIIIQKMMYSVFIMKGIKTVINLPKDVIETVIWPFSWFGGSKKDAKKQESNAQQGAQ